MNDEPKLHMVFPYQFDREATPTYRRDREHTRRCPRCSASMGYCSERYGEVGGSVHYVLTHHCNYGCGGALFEEIPASDGWPARYEARYGVGSQMRL